MIAAVKYFQAISDKFTVVCSQNEFRFNPLPANGFAWNTYADVFATLCAQEYSHSRMTQNKCLINYDIGIV